MGIAIEEPAGGSSLRFERAVAALMRMPGVGRRSAQRYALSLLARSEEERRNFVQDLEEFLLQSSRCPQCRNLSDDGALCTLCGSKYRDARLLCIVADMRDIMAIERSNSYNGLYFVLGGVIDPMRGIGPSNLPIEMLCQRLAAGQIQEVILALPSTPEGDTTSFYLQRQPAMRGLRLTRPARGLALGESLEQADELTLAAAFNQRMPVEITAPARKEVNH